MQNIGGFMQNVNQLGYNSPVFRQPNPVSVNLSQNDANIMKNTISTGGGTFSIFNPKSRLDHYTNS